MLHLLKKLFATLALAAVLLPAGAQTARKFSVKEAVEYARQNNIALQNAKTDEIIAQKKVKEVTADGLPQIYATVSQNNSPQIPVQRIPNFINSALPPGSPQGPEYVNVGFGIAHSLGAIVQWNQLLFDGTYFLGLKAAEEYVNMSRNITGQTEMETQVNVVKAYYGVLLADKRMALMDENIKSLDSTFKNTQAMQGQGFAEKVDVNRIELSLSNMQIMRSRVADQKRIMENILKMQMGFDVNQPIELTETLESLQSQFKPIDVSGNGAMTNRPEYKVLDQQVRLGILDEKRFKVMAYPKVTGFFNHQQNSYGQKYSELGKEWFGGTQWGVSVQMPLFTGFRRVAQLRQSSLRLDKYRMNIKQFELIYNNEVFTARTNYLRALENYQLQEKNIALANEVSRIAKLKLQEGLGSSLEYTTAEVENNNTKTNMVIALYDLLVAEIDYRKATGGKILE